jgi:hypothetical protein
VNTNFEFPGGLGLYAAGPAGDTISFFGNIFITRQNANGQNNLSIDRAYAQFRLDGEMKHPAFHGLKSHSIFEQSKKRFGSSWPDTFFTNDLLRNDISAARLQ